MNIEDYKNLVYSIVKKYSYNDDVEDLYQAGMIGLFQASNNFDSSKNVKFSTYAYQYIMGEVLKYIRENKLIKVNNDTLKLGKLINKTKDYLIQKNNKEPTIEELSSFLEIDSKTIVDTMNNLEYIRSLDECLYEDSKELNLYDSIKYNEKEYNDEVMDLKLELDNLDNSEKKLIKLRYFDDYSQSETSKELGMSQVQVSRKEKKILLKLKCKLT